VRVDDEGDHRRLVVCEARVWNLYAEPIQRALHGGPGRLDIQTLLLDLDEAGKALPAVCTVADAFDRFGLLRRSEPVLAIGGGVLLDVVGFTASLYRRGIPYVKVPTTLLAMIDAAIGVKTGINYGGAKSRLGTYYLPSGVLIDPTFLRTLDMRQYRSGLAESVKIALVADPLLFDVLEAHSRSLSLGAPDTQVEADVLDRSVTAMLDELSGNLCEDQL
jgi:2-epi-5-epi-valiolone synthase